MFGFWCFHGICCQREECRILPALSFQRSNYNLCIICLKYCHPLVLINPDCLLQYEGRSSEIKVYRFAYCLQWNSCTGLQHMNTIHSIQTFYFDCFAFDLLFKLTISILCRTFIATAWRILHSSFVYCVLNLEELPPCSHFNSQL